MLIVIKIKKCECCIPVFADVVQIHRFWNRIKMYILSLEFFVNTITINTIHLGMNQQEL